MTSFTKALYRRDPAAAEAFHRQSTFEQRAAHGRPGVLTFGRRSVPPAQVSDCPHSQTFCLDNGLMKANCSACKGLHTVEAEAERVVSRMVAEAVHCPECRELGYFRNCQHPSHRKR